jgi:tetratricopeptide (TPR) repeat protein
MEESGSGMKRGVRVLGVATLVALLGMSAGHRTAGEPAREGVPVSDQLAHHRNLGKAFYENPTTQAQAVEEFRASLALNPTGALDRLHLGLALLKAGKTKDGIAELEKVQLHDPSLPQTWFNLGVAWLKENEYEKSLLQLQRMKELVPAEPITHYNLGVVLKALGQSDASTAEFERAAQLAPQLAAPHFRLYGAYRAAGRSSDAARELAAFQENKQRQAGAAIPEDMEWNRFSEIDDVPEASPNDTAVALRPLSFSPQDLATPLDGASAGLTVFDPDGTGHAVLLAWSKKGVVWWRQGETAARPVPGLEELRGVVDVAAGDFNNDGLPDLCVLTEGGGALWLNRGGRFEAVATKLPSGHFRKAVWVDVDHDYDLDLLLFGDRSAFFRNDGAAGWSDHTADFPFVPGLAIDAVTVDLVSDSPAMDVVVSYADHAGTVYRDQLGGHYAAESLTALPSGAHGLAAADVDADGWTDVTAVNPEAKGGVTVLWNRHGQLESGVEVASGKSVKALAVTDFDSRAAIDLVAGDQIARWLPGGDGHSGSLHEGALPGIPQGLGAFSAMVSADFDGDGREDLALVREGGALTVLHNTTPSTGHWIEISLAGVRNPKQAEGARVEIKAGSVYQKKLYHGVPLIFGLRGRTQADTVRITWPNGLIQNETHQAAALKAGEVRPYKEAQRLSGSCPMIFVWNGGKFDFVTDVLGVAPLGASLGDGRYFPVDHTEWVSIPGSSLATVPTEKPSSRPAGREFEIRITEELHEVTYLDGVKLIALDHPAGVEVFSNEKFKSPPFPDFRLFGVTRRIRPLRAVDDEGRDVLAAILHRDGVYAEGFRHTLSGVADTHVLTLDFGPDAARSNRAVLYLSGWVDWADGSTFRAASQESSDGLILPRLEVRDATGQWRTAVADMGMPAGKPKTIAVDLAGKFLSSSREVRIVTNMCVYWDEIFLGENSGAPRTRLTPVPLASADLRFRGFSRPVVDPERRQPEAFDYQQTMLDSSWDPMPGFYTRYGNVRTLLNRSDDQFVIMGSGDEVRLRFTADDLPPLPSGWKRDFLLDVEGWAKDADPNTAFSRSVEPLPFHGMSAYPYGPQEHFPDDSTHRRWRAVYNRRPALRLLPSLAPARSGGGF